MTLSSLVFVTAALAAPGPAPAPAQPVVRLMVDERAPVDAAPVLAAQDHSPSSAQSPSAHRFGIGGSLSVGNHGAGGAVRYWFGERIGLDMMASYNRNSFGSSGVQSSSFQALPSMIVMLTPVHPNRDVDLRPFVGGGVNYSHASQTIQASNGSVSSFARGGTGMQVFGGVEMSFQEVRDMTVSAELAYYRLPVSFANSPALGGVNYIIAVHFYLK